MRPPAQVRAVREIIGLARAEFAELTGALRKEERARLWDVCRLLFLTPQTFVNDLEGGVCPASSVVCLVVDEAHKASGDHAYVQVMMGAIRRAIRRFGVEFWAIL